jgi:hypothetical protein
MNDQGNDKSKGKPYTPHEVVFYSYPKLIFAWPLIVVGILFWFIGFPGAKVTEPASADEVAAQVSDAAADAPTGEAAAEAAAKKAKDAATTTGHRYSPRLALLGWIYLFIVVLVMVTIGLDFERNHAFFWFVVFLVFLFLGMWLEEKEGFTLFGNVYNFFESLKVQYNRGLGLAISIMLALPYGVMLIWARMQNKWRITHNEFEHFSWGRADDSLARGAKRVRSTYPDLLELLLAGAGTLVVYSATGRSELRRIHNIPLLPLMRKRIDAILEQTAVTTQQQDAIHEEEVEAEREEDRGLAGDDDPGDDIGHEKL